MNTLTALVIIFSALFAGHTEAPTTAPTAPIEAVVSDLESDAWASFHSLSLDLVDPETDTISVYERTVDGNYEYRTSATEYPVWSTTDPTMVHIFSVHSLYYA